MHAFSLSGAGQTSVCLSLLIHLTSPLLWNMVGDPELFRSAQLNIQATDRHPKTLKNKDGTILIFDPICPQILSCCTGKRKV